VDTVSLDDITRRLHQLVEVLESAEGVLTEVPSTPAPEAVAA